MKHDGRILRRIEGVFSRVRPNRYRVPMDLKELAVSALGYGHDAGAIAKAAGVSKPTIANWERWVKAHTASPSAAPVQLKVIDRVVTPPTPEADPSVVYAVARIILRSGVRVELPVGALDAKLLLALNGGAR